ncbi:hypothetical protein Bca52824_030606 [Brassica carinata]|uniref:Uncharacterized protein n=1 Tax=Brassica carinata TaxID=52824 RepID=A0A8X7S8P7_BRACI|nr:hypothetical protein Bca52824_030606 [Brassica carinata]
MANLFFYKNPKHQISAGTEPSKKSEIVRPRLPAETRSPSLPLILAAGRHRVHDVETCAEQQAQPKSHHDVPSEAITFLHRSTQVAHTPFSSTVGFRCGSHAPSSVVAIDFRPPPS